MGIQLGSCASKGVVIARYRFILMLQLVLPRQCFEDYSSQSLSRMS